MNNLRNILVIGIAALTSASCFSSRTAGVGTTGINTSRDVLPRADSTSIARSGATGGVSATGSIIGTSGNAIPGQTAGTMGTANTTSGVEESSASAVPISASADSGTTGPAYEAEWFLKMAMINGLSELQLSELAVKNAQTNAVKKFAAMMIRYHGEANAELKTLAAAKRIALPDGAILNQLGSTSFEKMEKLRKSSGQTFDNDYVKQMIADHTKAVSMFEQGSVTKDPQIKAYAAKYLPTLKMHLQHVKALSKTNGK